MPNKSNRNRNSNNNTNQLSTYNHSSNNTTNIEYEKTLWHLKLFESPITPRKIDINDLQGNKRTLSSKGITKTVFKASVSSDLNVTSSSKNDDSLQHKLLKLAISNNDRYIYALGESKMLFFRYKYTKSELIDELQENYNIKHNKSDTNNTIDSKKTPFIIVLEKQLDLVLQNKELFNLKNRPFCWLYRHNLIVATNNLYNNSILIYTYKKDSVYIEKNIKAHTSIITKLECDDSNKYLISATNKGEVFFWEYFNSSLEITSKYYDPNHSEILDIYIDSKMLIAACSFRNGSITVFNICNGELISQINHPQNYMVNKV